MLKYNKKTIKIESKKSKSWLKENGRRKKR